MMAHTATALDKFSLFKRGLDVTASFCSANSLPAPGVRRLASDEWTVGACAYYRPTETVICVEKCAGVGVAGPAWSWPGYTVDRTPYGVLQHELGHHVDVLRSTRKGNYYGDFGMRVRQVSGEKPITSYCPNDAEWWAEMFRVFVTNPDLLSLVRPRTYREIKSTFVPLFEDTWRERLSDAPPRHIAAVERKIEAVR